MPIFHHFIVSNSPVQNMLFNSNEGNLLTCPEMVITFLLLYVTLFYPKYAVKRQ